jgi:hypothetical protein
MVANAVEKTAPLAPCKATIGANLPRSGGISIFVNVVKIVSLTLPGARAAWIPGRKSPRFLELLQPVLWCVPHWPSAFAQRHLAGHTNVSKHVTAQPQKAASLLLEAKKFSKFQCFASCFRRHPDGGFGDRSHSIILSLVGATPRSGPKVHCSRVSGCGAGATAVPGFGTRRTPLLSQGRF